MDKVHISGTEKRILRAVTVFRGRCRDGITPEDLGYSRVEGRVMGRVMRETDGDGGPWFYQYAIKNNLL